MEPRHQQIRTALLNGTLSQGPERKPADAEVEFFVESELIEDFLEGTLSETESELFLRNFMVTQDRRDLLNEIRLLKRYSSGSYEFDARKIEAPHPELPSQPKPSFAWLIGIAAIAAIAIFAAWWFGIFERLHR